MSESNESTAYQLRDGSWQQTPGPGEHEGMGGSDRAADRFRADGWEPFITLGTYVWISALRRIEDGVWKFLVLVGGLEHMVAPVLYVDSLPEVMDLLARWSPVVQTHETMELLESIRYGMIHSGGTVEALGARLRYGWDHHQEIADHLGSRA